MKAVARNSIKDYLDLEPADLMAKQTALAKEQEEIRRWNNIVGDIRKAKAKGHFLAQVVAKPVDQEKLLALNYKLWRESNASGYMHFVYWGSKEQILATLKELGVKGVIIPTIDPVSINKQ